MKNRTKIAGFILIITMIMTMFTMNVSAATLDPITSVTISGLTAPAVAKEPVAKAAVTANNSVVVADVTWDGTLRTGTDSKNPADNAKDKKYFQGGIAYKATVVLTAPTGSDFTGLKADGVAAAGSEKVAISLTENNTKCTVTVTFAKLDKEENQLDLCKFATETSITVPNQTPFAAQFGAVPPKPITFKVTDKYGVELASTAAKATVTSSDSSILTAKLDATNRKITFEVKGGSPDGEDVTITVSVPAKANANTEYVEDEVEITFKVVRNKTTLATMTSLNYVVTAKADNIYKTSETKGTLSIDFSSEKMVVDGEKVVAYSADGGKKWKEISIAKGATSVLATGKGTDISKILDKGGAMMFTSKMDGKAPAIGATIWELTINPRPKGQKLTPYYGLVDADGNLVNSSRWTVAINGSVPSAEDLAGDDAPVILYATSTDGKVADKTKADSDLGQWKATFGFKTFNFKAGELIKPLLKDAAKNTFYNGGKPGKFTYLAKIAPVITKPATADDEWELTPASKVSKLKVTSETKQPSIKVDYKKEKVILKAGMAYYFSGLTDSLIMDKANAKNGLPFKGDGEDVIGVLDNVAIGASKYVTAWIAPNGKKAGSCEITVKVWGDSAGTNVKAADITTGIKNPGTDKVSFKLPKGYQVREVGGDTWSTSITVSVTADATTSDEAWEIRKVGTAKFDSKNAKTWINDVKATTTAPMKLTFGYKSVSTGKGDDKVTNFYLNKANIGPLS